VKKRLKKTPALTVFRDIPNTRTVVTRDGFAYTPDLRHQHRSPSPRHTTSTPASQQPRQVFRVPSPPGLSPSDGESEMPILGQPDNDDLAEEPLDDSDEEDEPLAVSRSSGLSRSTHTHPHLTI
jgi:hypothetical protein